MNAAVQRRRITGWHILGGVAILLSAIIALTVTRSVVWVITHGVGYVLTHAWWNR